MEEGRQGSLKCSLIGWQRRDDAHLEGRLKKLDCQRDREASGLREGCETRERLSLSWESLDGKDPRESSRNQEA